MPYSAMKTIENGMTLKPPIGRFSIKAAPIGRRGTGDFARTRFLFSTGDWTTPFTVMAFWTVASVDHTESGSAQRSTIRVNVQAFQDTFWSAAVRIQVNEGCNVPFFA